MDFSKNIYMMRCSNMLAAHSLEKLFPTLLISKYFTEYRSVLAPIVTFFSKWRPLMHIILALASQHHF